MRIALVLAILVVFGVCSSDAAWVRSAWRRNKGWIISAAINYALPALGKRNVEELDVNKDGMVDQKEMESVLSTRDVEDLLKSADDNGEISLEEFAKALNDLHTS